MSERVRHSPIWISPERAHLLYLLWTLPYAMLGLPIYLLARRSGRVGRCKGVYIAFGGASATLVRCIRARAFACGPFLFFRDKATLVSTFEHEYEHVAQYSRWGWLFWIAYGLCSIGAVLRRGRLYHDNYFERRAQAFDECPLKAPYKLRN